MRSLISAAFVALMSVGANAATLTNGDFETGTLDGWSVTTVGAGNTEISTVDMFDVTGSGESNAAHFNVGRAGPLSGPTGGISVSQNFAVAVAGTYSFSIDLAVMGGPFKNLTGGVFNLLSNGVLLDTFNTGEILADEIRRATLTGVADLDVGVSTFSIEILRPANSSSNTPHQFLDNAVVTGPETSAVPLPAGMVLLFTGLGGLALVRRKS